MYGALVFRKRDSAGRGQRQATAGIQRQAPDGAQLQAPAETQPRHLPRPSLKETTPFYSATGPTSTPTRWTARLHAGTDWYAIRKGSEQDYAAAIEAGYLKTKLTNEWKRMLPMDVSDVAYDRFLANGRASDTAGRFKAGGTRSGCTLSMARRPPTFGYSLPVEK